MRKLWNKGMKDGNGDSPLRSPHPAKKKETRKPYSSPVTTGSQPRWVMQGQDAGGLQRGEPRCSHPGTVGTGCSGKGHVKGDTTYQGRSGDSTATWQARAEAVDMTRSQQGYRGRHLTAAGT